MAHEEINLTLQVWRQEGPNKSGKFETHKVRINTHMSFLEMLDVLNEQ
jgi:succinate dehydrogenase / fumarate reductase iron-sulfur subunit